MEMRTAAWGRHGGGAFPCRSGSNVRVDRKSSLQQIINFQCRQHAYRRLHEFAFLRATPPCTQLRRTGASLAYFGTNHLIPIRTMMQNSPAIPFVLETTLYYRRVAADTVCFDVGVPIVPAGHFVLPLPCSYLYLQGEDWLGRPWMAISLNNS